MKRFISLVSLSIISATSSIAVSSVMNGLAAPRNSNAPRCSAIKPGGQYWLEYKDNLGRTQSTKAALIVGGAKVCISNPG